MGNKYILTGVQLGILMSHMDEKTKMDILNDVMNNQLLEDIFEINVGNEKFLLRGK